MTKIKTMAEVLLQAEDKTVLIVRRPEDDMKRPGQWDVPGGHVNEGEELLAAASRETLEETGIQVNSQDLSLGHAISKPWDTSLSCNWLFFCVNTSKQDPVLSDEHIDFAWVPLDEAINMIEYNIQKDALTYIRDNQLLN